MIMKWKPHMPVRSVLLPRVKVDDPPKAYGFSRDAEGKPRLGGFVKGEEAFIQTFQKTLLTENSENRSYGLKSLLPYSEKQIGFNQQCERLADAIVSHRSASSSEELPGGLGYTVEEVKSIEWNSEKNEFFITLLADGLNSPVRVQVGQLGQQPPLS